MRWSSSRLCATCVLLVAFAGSTAQAAGSDARFATSVKVVAAEQPRSARYDHSRLRALHARLERNGTA